MSTIVPNNSSASINTSSSINNANSANNSAATGQATSTLPSSNEQIVGAALQNTAQASVNAAAPTLTAPKVAASGDPYVQLNEASKLDGASIWSSSNLSTLLTQLKQGADKNPLIPAETYKKLVDAIKNQQIDELSTQLKTVLDDIKTQKYLVSKEVYDKVEKAVKEQQAALSDFETILKTMESLEKTIHGMQEAILKQKMELWATFGLSTETYSDADFEKFYTTIWQSKLSDITSKQYAQNESYKQLLAAQAEMEAKSAKQQSALPTAITTLKQALSQATDAFTAVKNSPIDPNPTPQSAAIQSSLSNIATEYLDNLGKLMIMLAVHTNQIDTNAKETLTKNIFESQKIRDMLKSLTTAAVASFQKTLNVMKGIMTAMSWMVTALLGLAGVFLRLMGVNVVYYVKKMFSAALGPITRGLKKLIRTIMTSLTNALASSFEKLGMSQNVSKMLGTFAAIAIIALTLMMLSVVLPGVGTTVAIGAGLLLLANRDEIIKPLIENTVKALGDALTSAGLDAASVKKITDAIKNVLFTLVVVITAIIPQMGGKDKMFSSVVKYFGRMIADVLKSMGVNNTDAKLAGKLTAALSIALLIIIEMIILAVALGVATGGAGSAAVAAEIPATVLSIMRAIQQAVTSITTIVSIVKGISDSGNQLANGIGTSAMQQLTADIRYFQTILHEIQKWASQTIQTFGEQQGIKQQLTVSQSDASRTSAQAANRVIQNFAA